MDGGRGSGERGAGRQLFDPTDGKVKTHQVVAPAPALTRPPDQGQGTGQGRGGSGKRGGAGRGGKPKTGARERERTGDRHGHGQKQKGRESKQQQSVEVKPVQLQRRVAAVVPNPGPDPVVASRPPPQPVPPHPHPHPVARQSDRASNNPGQKQTRAHAQPKHGSAASGQQRPRDTDKDHQRTSVSGSSKSGVGPRGSSASSTTTAAAASAAISAAAAASVAAAAAASASAIATTAVPLDTHSAHSLISSEMVFVDTSRGLFTEGPGKDFLVVGVIGPQGVGKSTVMQLLHGDATTSFNVQQSAAETQATHTTVGVDVAVTQEHGILLDSQPMQSLAVVDALAKRKSPMVAGCRSYDQIAELQSHHLTIFLLATCDVVLVVHDWAVDTSFLRHLQVCESLLPIAVTQSTTVSATSTKRATREAAESMTKSPATEPPVVAEALFVFNRMGEDCRVGHAESQHAAAISAFFRHSGLVGSRLVPRVPFGVGVTDTAPSVDQLLVQAAPAVETSTAAADAAARVCYLPEKPGATDDAVLWELAVEELRNHVFQSHRIRAQGRQHSSERDWWMRTRQVWTNICASDAVSDYVAALYTDD